MLENNNDILSTVDPQNGKRNYLFEMKYFARIVPNWPEDR